MVQSQYLKLISPSLPADLHLSIGFQRVASIVDHSSSSSVEDAIIRTVASLHELYIGWGPTSSEWKDLIRVMQFYSYPRFSDNTQESLEESLTAIAAHVCEGTRRLVELLCVIQSICLQRLANALQHSLRQISKELSYWKERAAIPSPHPASFYPPPTNISKSLGDPLAQLELMVADYKDRLSDLENQLSLLHSQNTKGIQDFSALQTQYKRLESDYLEQGKLLAETQEKLTDARHSSQQLANSEVTKERDVRMKLEAEVAYLMNRLSNAESVAFNQAVEIANLQVKVQHYETLSNAANVSSIPSSPRYAPLNSFGTKMPTSSQSMSSPPRRFTVPATSTSPSDTRASLTRDLMTMSNRSSTLFESLKLTEAQIKQEINKLSGDHTGSLASSVGLPEPASTLSKPRSMTQRQPTTSSGTDSRALKRSQSMVLTVQDSKQLASNTSSARESPRHQNAVEFEATESGVEPVDSDHGGRIEDPAPADQHDKVLLPIMDQQVVDEEPMYRRGPQFNSLYSDYVPLEQLAHQPQADGVYYNYHAYNQEFQNYTMRDGRRNGQVLEELEPQDQPQGVSEFGYPMVKQDDFESIDEEQDVENKNKQHTKQQTSASKAAGLFKIKSKSSFSMLRKVPSLKNLLPGVMLSKNKKKDDNGSTANNSPVKADLSEFRHKQELKTIEYVTVSTQPTTGIGHFTPRYDIVERHDTNGYDDEDDPNALYRNHQYIHPSQAPTAPMQVVDGNPDVGGGVGNWWSKFSKRI